MLGRSAIGGAVIPLAVYYLVHHQVSTASALAIAGVPAALWVIFHWLWRRTIDPIGMLVLVGFALGLSVSFAMGGNAFVLKVRDSAVTATFGVLCLASLWVARRPLLFYLGRSMAAGDDPVRRRLYDQLWELPTGRMSFRVLTALWGIGLIAEASVRVTLARLLPTGAFLAVSPIVTTIFFGGLFAFTLWYARWTRVRATREGGATP